MIGSQTHLGFIDFAVNLVPVVLMIHIATMAVFYSYIDVNSEFQRSLKQSSQNLIQLRQLKIMAY